MCTNGQITAVLWEDDEEHYSYLKKIKRDLMKTLKAVDCEDIINSQREKIGIAKDQIEWTTISGWKVPPQASTLIMENT